MPQENEEVSDHKWYDLLQLIIQASICTLGYTLS